MLILFKKQLLPHFNEPGAIVLLLILKMQKCNSKLPYSYLRTKKILSSWTPRYLVHSCVLLMQAKMLRL